MSFDPRRALVGLAMAGALVIAPPAIGYAMSGISPHGSGARIQGVFEKNDNGDAHVNDNAENDNFSNDNDSAAVPAPGADGAYVPPPTTGPSGPPTEDSANNNNPNNQDSPGNGGNP
jgi:hypothetical protein